MNLAWGKKLNKSNNFKSFNIQWIKCNGLSDLSVAKARPQI